MGIHGLSEYFTERFSSNSSASSHLFRITTWLPRALPYRTLPGLALWDLEDERDHWHTSIFLPPFHIYFRRLVDRKVEHISDQWLWFGSRWIRPISDVRNIISNTFDNHQEKKCSQGGPANHTVSRKKQEETRWDFYRIKLYIMVYISNYVWIWPLSVTAEDWSKSSTGVKRVPSKPAKGQYDRRP